MSLDGSSQFARRAMIRGLCAIPLALQQNRISAATNGGLSEVEFYCGKSGRYGYEESPHVAIGGLLVPKGEAQAIEARMRSIASGMNFTKQLEFSTGKNDPTYLAHALEFLSDYEDVAFAIMRVEYEHWPDNREGRQAFRSLYEERAFKNLRSSWTMRVHSMRHDLGLDEKIFREIVRENSNVTGFELYPYPNTAPRLLQLSGTLVKCLNRTSRLVTSAQDQRRGAILKNRMVRIAVASVGAAQTFTPQAMPTIFAPLNGLG